MSEESRRRSARVAIWITVEAEDEYDIAAAVERYRAEGNDPLESVWIDVNNDVEWLDDLEV